jgi:enoyl-CoA hydratase
MTGWGQDGPLPSGAGHDINYMSITGVLGATGEAGRAPSPPLNRVADYGGGSMLLVVGILAALHERANSGLGPVINVAMVEGVTLLAQAVWYTLGTGDWVDSRGVQIVLAAEGKYFSAGGDFDFILAGQSDLSVRRRLVNEGERLLVSLLDVRPPIVAAVQGDAIGLGATLALSCDVVVAHPTCRIADPHVAIGLVAGDGGCLVWPQAVGVLRAKWHLLTGETITGDEAHRIGMVTKLVDTAEEVLPAAREVARRLAGLPPLAVQGTKRVLNTALRARFDEVGPIGFAHELTSMGSGDLVEAIAAFKEKRAPKYSGS